jgi:hypothetical protein
MGHDFRRFLAAVPGLFLAGALRELRGAEIRIGKFAQIDILGRINRGTARTRKPPRDMDLRVGAWRGVEPPKAEARRILSPNMPTPQDELNE